MSEPYTYKDLDGDKLVIERGVNSLPETVYISARPGAFVPAADLPKIVAELYKAAGQEPPIVMARPSADELRAHGWIDGQRVNVDAIRTAGLVTPGRARGFAACLAASADIAESEPSPEQVKQLADLIENGNSVFRGEAERAARAVLRAGYTRSES